MDVFLDSNRSAGMTGPLQRLALSVPLQSMTADMLPTEATRLRQRQINYVSVRRQQVLRIGEHVLLDVLTDYGISISCLGFAGGFTGVFGQSWEEVCSDTVRAIDLAQDLCASGVIVVPGTQGLHTYRHAERNIRDGLAGCLPHAADSDIQLFVPTDSVLPCRRDSFRTQNCPLAWVQEFGNQRIQPMIVVRSRDNYLRLPRCWRQSLADGGCLRLCHRSDDYVNNTLLLKRVIRLLSREHNRWV